jgi:hypothetical protein
MFLYELLEFVKEKKLVNVFVVPSDMIPQAFDLPAGFIINLSPSSHHGTHWIAIFISVHGSATYFCSFGMPPTVNTIKNFLRMSCKSHVWNRQQLQKIKSDWCGAYAAAFLFYAFKGVSLDSFLKHFSSNLFLNDMLISKMFKRLKFSN